MGIIQPVVLIYTHLLLQIDIITCVDISSLMHAYEAVCGGMVCETTELKFHRQNGTLTNKHFCPACSCNETCFKTRNCCPDLFLKLPFVCVKTSIWNHEGLDVDTPHVAMIETCPLNVVQAVNSKCAFSVEDMKNKLQNVPVTSRKTGLTYRNIHCLRCNEESGVKIEPWDIEIQCQEFADFNFLSSYEEIIEQAERGRCNISYSSIAVNSLWDDVCYGSPKLNNSDTSKVINKCNVTGTWNVFDPDIEYMCKMYDNKFRVFKNIFCYMCNPPIITEIPIGVCNVSGLWELYDQQTEEGCETVGGSTVTHPFKNHYCFLCNVGSRRRTRSLFFNHYEMEEHFQIDTLAHALNFTVTLTFSRLNITEIIKGGKQFLESTNKDEINLFNSNKPYQVATVPTSLDMEKLMLKYVASTGKANFNRNYSFVNNIRQPCDNSNTCFFSSTCCIEKYFEKQVKCTDNSIDGKGYLVINSCPNPELSFLKILCNLDYKDHFLSTQPVKLNLKNSNVIYSNIYCAMCNNVTREPNNKNNLQLLKLRLSCPVYTSPYYFNSLDSYLEFSVENDCLIGYLPISSDGVCESKSTKCNMTGSLQIYDKDVDYACRNIPQTEQTSIFCEMCNPVKREEIIFTSCNQTGKWDVYDKYVESYCANLPYVETMVPYKNFYCKVCNRLENIDMQWRSTNAHFVNVIINPEDVSYRTIFAFSNYRKTDGTILFEKCDVNQMFTLGKCREIVCYPGKIHVDSGCVPLLQITSNLGYLLSTSFQTTLTQHVNDVDLFHHQVDSTFQQLILHSLNITTIRFESSILQFNLNCPDNRQHRIENRGVIFDLQYKFFIEDRVNRSMVERRLLELKQDNFNVTFPNTTSVLYSNHVGTTSIINKHGFTGRCNYINMHQAKNVPIIDKYYHSHVNELLLCEQVEISADEFILDERKSSITIDYIDTEVASENFLLVAPLKARLCVNYTKTFETKVPSSKDSVNGIWNTITFVCIIISLLCLLVTFVTYCLFRSLRTLPGKNNMCLVFAMFVSNVTFLLMVLGAKSHVGCQIIGICVHFFWLATFTCLNVCSFHMFRVFTSITGPRLSERRTFVMYVLYSFGAPALIIILNVAITSIVTSGLIGYGDTICFLDQKLAFLITFIVPVSVICILNITFFVFVSRAIAQRPKLKDDSNMKANHIQFIVYIKLFALTGTTWIFQIVDSFVPESAFSTIVAILNALQGVLIFLSYICNKRVLDLYRRNLKKKRSFRSTSNKRTLTTNLNRDNSIV